MRVAHEKRKCANIRGMDLLSKQRDIRSKRSSATPIPLSWLLACFMSHFRAKIRLSKDGRKHFSPLIHISSLSCIVQSGKIALNSICSLENTTYLTGGFFPAIEEKRNCQRISLFLC